MTTATKTEVTTNDEQELYVIPCGDGFSCLGYDVCLRRSEDMELWLRRMGCVAVTTDRSKRGTLEAYRIYRANSEAVRQTGKQCPCELTPELIGKEGWRVEVVDCYGEKRRFIVGKSTGWTPCHLEIKRVNSSGGGAVTGTPFKSLRFIQEVR